ncbi:autotransporter outer membrane beta-barrel domain-containing protein [Salmonella enterica]|uniref:Autotransporter outer membrane beta-barrel domain-containing protein n=1 Tax=Salmonella enterica subsp. VII serovar 40:z4,z24:[z39] TaxID=1967625 RepID=A0A731TH08_SALEE|nr:autotransporter outer membrane beta-barrel domain-containing protein [Salmonella enterica]EDO5298474.1 autotransporter outer membrane beta-barrel domain-containing protein [Salmonella enterica subsp. houtenae serovar 40:z4,z24:-]QUZ22931.1 autotransporter outer membrane beta-barrel domain-containing protein [Salmonella enterica subsp. VII str. CFSAN000554]HAE4734302.1 autotransporter outer membrane beta-barrel domain-containing protein [Salmonella enterica subsp. VII serovar 40:z4,z24:[z39]]
MKLVPYLVTLTLTFIPLSARADYHTQINAGNTVSGDIVDGSKGDQHVYGTLADSIITGPYAWSYVGDGGQTNNIMVTDRGELFLEPGGSAYGTQIATGGELQVNGYAENTYVGNGGLVYVNAGKNGVEAPSQGGLIVNTTIGAGGLMVNRYGIDTNTVVEAGGELDTGWNYPYEIRNTAISRNAVIQNGGIQQVSNGGTSESSQIEDGGTLIVTGTWHYNVVTDDQPSAWYRGTANDTAVYGTMQNQGGLDENTTVQSGGQYTLGGYGRSQQLTVAHQINDGALDSFWLYGIMDVSSQATLTGTGSVGSSGELVLNEGAKTSGLTLALDGVLSLQNGSDAGPHSYQIAGLEMNGGIVLFDPTSFATLNMETLSGSGNFWMNTDITAQQGDMINVSGEANGNFGIRVNDTGKSPTDPQSLQVVQTSGGDAQFTLLNPNQQVDIGTWEYGLTPDGQGNWSLTPQAAPTPSTETVLAMANVTPTIFQTEASALQTRLDVTRSRPHQGELWAQALSNRFDVNRTGNAAYRQRLGVLMMGYDKSLSRQTDLLTFGIAGGYSRSDLDLANDSDGSVDSYSAAVYASYYDQSRFWLDGMLKGNLFNQHLNARMSSGGHADGSYTIPGMGGSLIAGYDARFARTTLSPFIGFTGFISQSDDYRMSNGMQAHPGTAKSALGQVGFRLRQNITTCHGMQLVPWLRVALEQEFVHNNPVKVNDDSFNNDIAGTRGSYQAGISAALTQHTHIYASINYGKGDGMESPWSGNAGFSYRF